MKKGAIIAAVLFVVAGLALFSAAFIAADGDFSKFSTVKYETNTYTAEDRFETIEIDTDETDVTLKPSEDGKFSVVCVEREKVRHAVTVENGTLRIGCVDKRAWYDHLTFFSKPLTMTVYLPADRYEMLKIDSGTGDIQIPASLLFGSIDIQVSTGDVLCDASVSGKIRAKTSTGEVRMKDVHADRLTVSVSTGNIWLKNTVAANLLEIHTSTGDVHFENCDAGQMKIKTSTGDVTGTLQSEKNFSAKSSTGLVRVPQTTSGGNCDITTSTGDIQIGFSNRIENGEKAKDEHE